MYAVIKTGGKQYKVASNDVIKIEKIAGEAGSEIIFNEVLAMGETVGTPLVAGATVKVQLLNRQKTLKLSFSKRKEDRTIVVKTVTDKTSQSSKLPICVNKNN